MRSKFLITVAIIGFLLSLATAYIFGLKQKPLPPAFTPASNPYSDGIYASGIIETPQSSGENINIYPEVTGTVNKIMVTEGQNVQAGDVLLTLDDSVQRSTTLQQKSQISGAAANLQNSQDAYDKQYASWTADPRSVSKDALDTAKNAVAIARANLEVGKRQYDSAASLLSKYQIKAMTSGKVLSINTALGSYISPQGVYDTYTGQANPIIVMGQGGDHLAVRTYVDEILIQRLPEAEKMTGYMSIRGSEAQIPLKFMRVQPNVSPKIELSNQRTERVDVRVLPIIFSFEKPKDMTLYPGQLVDVYIAGQHAEIKK